MQHMGYEKINRLVDASWVSTRIGCTPQHAVRLIKAGVFGPAVDVNAATGQRGQWRVEEDAVEAWIKRRTVR